MTPQIIRTHDTRTGKKNVYKIQLRPVAGASKPQKPTSAPDTTEALFHIQIHIPDKIANRRNFFRRSRFTFNHFGIG